MALLYIFKLHMGENLIMAKYIMKVVEECSDANKIAEKFEEKGEKASITMKKYRPRDKYYSFRVNVIVGGSNDDKK